MKGVIFNLLEQAVTEAHGEDTWNVLLDDAKLDGVYAAVGSYPDTDLLALVEAGSARLGVEPNALVRWFGETALPLLAERYPEFFEHHSSLATFLPTLNDVIHAEVRKLYPEADVPEFGFLTGADGVLALDYRSPRRLCALAEGFIVAAGRHFGEQVSVTQPECMIEGAPRCLLEVRIEGGGSA